MRLRYAFRVRPPGDDLLVAINVLDGRGPILVAVQTGQQRALNDTNLARAFLAQPLVT